MSKDQWWPNKSETQPEQFQTVAPCKPWNVLNIHEVSQTSIYAMFSLKPSLIPFVGIMYIICTTEYPQELFKRTRIDHALKKKIKKKHLHGKFRLPWVLVAEFDFFFLSKNTVEMRDLEFLNLLFNNWIWLREWVSNWVCILFLHKLCSYIHVFTWRGEKTLASASV